MTNFHGKFFRRKPLKIYLHEYLTHKYYHTRKIPSSQYVPIVLLDSIDVILTHYGDIICPSIIL